MNSAEPSSWSQTPKSRSLAPSGADESNAGRTEQNRDFFAPDVSFLVGRAEGFLVGLAEGFLVGRLVGLLVGRLVGFAALTAQSGRTSTWMKVINLIFYEETNTNVSGMSVSVVGSHCITKSLKNSQQGKIV